MEKIGAKSAPAMLACLFVFAGAVGCGPSRDPSPFDDDEPSRKALEESQRLYERAAKDHVIGYDSTGLPVYGVDEEGNPITRRDH